MLRSYLKREKVSIDSLPGESFEICELSAADQIEIIALSRTDRSDFSGALVCRLSVSGWREHSIEEISAALTSEAIGQLARKVYALAGVDLEALMAKAHSPDEELAESAKKKSVNGQAGDSSFDSQPWLANGT